tara:strand:+ start:156 stop:626 length:471 start_codon:yes stop_codon:yes gene_type:complete
MDDMPVLRQFKLVNDDEVVCEVIDAADSDGTHLVVRNTLKIINMENMASGQRFFAFRPWITFQGDEHHMTILNGNQIVAESTPSKDCVIEYKKNLDVFNGSDLNSLDETTKTLKEYFKKQYNKFEDEMAASVAHEPDSGDNVIKGPWVYPGNDTIN